MIGIYKITNTVNKKFYIGSSKNIKQRVENHFRYLRLGSHVNRHLQLSYNKYGKNNFIVEIIEECEEQILIDREQYYLDNCNWLKTYNKARFAYKGGAEVCSIEHVLLDLDGNVVDRFFSGIELARNFKIMKQIDYNSVNTDAVFKRTYRIVTLDFYTKNIDTIYSWKNFEEIHKKFA